MIYLLMTFGSGFALCASGWFSCHMHVQDVQKDLEFWQTHCKRQAALIVTQEKLIDELIGKANGDVQ